MFDNWTEESQFFSQKNLDKKIIETAHFSEVVNKSETNLENILKNVSLLFVLLFLIYQLVEIKRKYNSYKKIVWHMKADDVTYFRFCSILLVIPSCCDASYVTCNKWLIVSCFVEAGKKLNEKAKTVFFQMQQQNLNQSAYYAFNGPKPSNLLN